MPTTTQIQNIWLLSDTVLYPEAVAFMSRLIRDQECKPPPNSQVAGLLSIAESHQYNELKEFVLHQRTRNWPPGKRDIGIFYTALEETLKNMETRLRGDFHLVSGKQRPGSQLRPEEHELMALLAREFIQHLIAENGVLAATAVSEWRQQPRQSQPARPNQHMQQRQTGGRYGNQR